MPITTDGQQLVYPSDTEAGVDNRRLSANVSYDQELLTFQDAVEHVLDVYDVPRDSRNHRLAIKAVIKAQRMLPTYHQWPYYRRPLVVQTVAQYSTGTIAYDYTGGAYERMVTLTSGTWPTWASFGVLRISNVDYPVLQRVSDTVLTLDTRRCPVADIASNTAYTLFRNRYPLPLDFRRHDAIFEAGTNRELRIVDPALAMTNTIVSGGTSEPWLACIVEDENYQGGLALMVSPAVNSATSLQFLYERKMRPLVTEKYDTGTVTITENSATVTGSGTAWTDKMIGAVLRVSVDSNAPTPLEGSIASASANPADYTRIIMGVNSATELLVDETLGETASGRAYTISDPVDLTDVMIDVFLRLAELEYAKLTGREDVHVRNATFWDALDVARNAVRHSTKIEHATQSDNEGYSLIGSVDVRPDL